ncbi:hypothetical protein JFL43_16670 [Viridibacillus sp. YIM B01967]|uniref:Sodium:dicarboxylate symporter n=1 Tax=Viridibacillus soli TaxID=2798301 RepID=A0ABS1HAK0_9BACL|nr:hypothetical protein [Viridibacillus soli]MBK3496462.1 hypothetical protein [Viridibacillus soli]
MILILASSVLAFILILSEYLKSSKIFNVFYLISLVSVIFTFVSFIVIGGFEALGYSFISLLFGIVGVGGMLVTLFKKKQLNM